MPNVIFKIRGESEPEKPIELEWFIEKGVSNNLIRLCVKDNIVNKEWIVCSVDKKGITLWEALPDNIGLEVDKNGYIEITNK